jgi:hypothetical protein
VKDAKALVVVPDGPEAIVVLGGLVSTGRRASSTPMLRPARVTVAVRLPLGPATGWRACESEVTAPWVFFRVDAPGAAASQASIMPPGAVRLPSEATAASSTSTVLGIVVVMPGLDTAVPEALMDPLMASIGCESSIPSKVVMPPAIRRALGTVQV